MATKTTQAVRKVSNGNMPIFFNDRLKDGRRSLKVWGWSLSQYLLAAKILKDQGCLVRVVTFTGQGWYTRNKTVTRLHVTE